MSDKNEIFNDYLNKFLSQEDLSSTDNSYLNIVKKLNYIQIGSFIYVLVNTQMITYLLDAILILIEVISFCSLFATQKVLFSTRKSYESVKKLFCGEYKYKNVFSY